MRKNKSPYIVAFALSLAGCGGSGDSSETVHQEPRGAEQRMGRMAIPVERVPLKLHRRAAQLLAGEHDVPIAHWSFQGLPPTELLTQQASTAIT